MKHLRAEPPAPRSLRAGIPRGIEAVILKALAKDPNDRFQTAAEMGSALSSNAGNADTRVMPATTRVPRTEPPPAGAKADMRWGWALLAIGLLVALLAWLIPTLADDIGSEGRGGQPGGEQGDAGEGDAIEVGPVADFDPHGTGGEHGEDAELAADGNESTEWATENYDDPFELIGKPGVGLVFDLRDSVEVARVEISGNAGPLEVMAADEMAPDETGFESVGQLDGLDGSESVGTEGTSGRYWLVWITELPEGAGTASLAEVVFYAP
jgi:hypothetical protein